MSQPVNHPDAGTPRSQPAIAPLAEADLPVAKRIFGTAFGTFLGVPDPENFWSDRDLIFGRWRAPHVASFGAKIDGGIAGSNFATQWGSVGFFGPLSVRPDLQECGIAKALLGATVDQFAAWEPPTTGCSPSHKAPNTWRCIRSSASTPGS